MAAELTLTVAVDLNEIAERVPASEVVAAYGAVPLLDAMDYYEAMDHLGQQPDFGCWVRDCLPSALVAVAIEDRTAELLRELGRSLGDRCRNGRVNALTTDRLRALVEGIVEGLRPRADAPKIAREALAF